MPHRYLDRRQNCVYILSSRRRVLYVGVTSNLAARLRQHRSGNVPGFAKRYNVNQLVFAEASPYIEDAIAREKEIKGWKREKKIALILELNPEWKDLAEEWELAGS